MKSAPCLLLSMAFGMLSSHWNGHKWAENLGLWPVVEG